MSKRSVKSKQVNEQRTSKASFIELYNGQKVNLIDGSDSTGISPQKFKINQRKVSSKFDYFSKWRQLLAEIFLPKGFPNSVTADYIEYQIWDTVQAFASSLSSTLATAAVLKGAGVGDETATVLAASISWILKDGFGMLGRIVFAWAFGTSLDSDCKRWRLIADFLNDLAFCIDLTCSHTERRLFMFTVCCSSLMRAIVGVAGGGTRMAVIRHQARRENLADVAAKDGSQETLVGIVSLLASLLILPAVDGRPLLVWSLFLALTIVHLLANYFAVKSLQFDILNEQRLKILARNFAKTGKILNVLQANQQESILCPSIGSRNQRKYGCSLLNLNDCHNIGEYLNENDEICAQLGWINDYGVLAIRNGSTSQDVLMAAFELELRILKSPYNTSTLLEQLKSQGWNVDSHLLSMDEFTFDENL